MVEVFREVRRVLREDGTCWVNLGDTYANAPVGRFNGGGFVDVSAATGGRDLSGVATSGLVNKLKASGLKQKDLVGIPWRVAFALQADGWWLRQDIIWHKPNPMPESVRDRCTKAHEYVFLLTKSERYYYDAEVVKEPLAQSSIGRAERKQRLIDRAGVGTIGKQVAGGVDASHGYAGLALARNGKTGYDLESGTRNRRSVWTVTTKPYSGAHFAVMPSDLVEPCIKAGCPEGGTVLDPFAGSGTTLAVAAELGRSGIGCELNPEYIALAERRIKDARASVALFEGVPA
jgi:DNA modification methylase